MRIGILLSLIFIGFSAPADRSGKCEDDFSGKRDFTTTYFKDGAFSFEPHHRDSSRPQFKRANHGKSNAEALRDIKLYRMRRTDDGF